MYRVSSILKWSNQEVDVKESVLPLLKKRWHRIGGRVLSCSQFRVVSVYSVCQTVPSMLYVKWVVSPSDPLELIVNGLSCLLCHCCLINEEQFLQVEGTEKGTTQLNSIAPEGVIPLCFRCMNPLIVWNSAFLCILAESK